jgi:tryptophan synthase beta chain
VGPEHSFLHDIGRAEYRPVTDAEAMEAFALLCRTEGIIPAIESAHALAGAMVLGRELGEGALLLVNLSGRGDKDVETASRWFGLGDREHVEPGAGLDEDQQPTEGAVSNDDAVPGQAAGESA